MRQWFCKGCDNGFVKGGRAEGFANGFTKGLAERRRPPITTGVQPDGDSTEKRVLAADRVATGGDP